MFCLPCVFSGAGIKHLCEVIRGKRLAYLNLDHNQIGDNGMAALGTAMQMLGEQFNTLDIAFNSIGSRGMELFASNIAGARCLPVLVVANDNLASAEAMRAVLEAASGAQ
jgi:hypothetical protein